MLHRFLSRQSRRPLARLVLRNTSTSTAPRPSHLTDTTANRWSLRLPPSGSGFDHFFRGNSGDQQDGSNSSNNNNDNNNRSPFGPELAIFVFLMGMLALRSQSSAHDEKSLQHQEDHHHNRDPSRASHLLQSNREISWHEFLQLLQQQDIVKIVVSDQERPVARVYLKPGAVGLTSASFLSYEEQRNNRLQRSRAVDHEDNMHGDTTLEAGFSTSTTISRDSSFDTNSLDPLSSSSASRNEANKHLLFAYRLQIGSIDAFEHKLEEAQRALGRNPANDVPVQYSASDTIGKEFLNAVPGIIFAGVLYGVMRLASGGMGIGGFGGGGAGGRGGMGGIFQIGKSTAKKISKEDVKVNFGDVAGCEEAKREIMEFVDFLKDADRFTRLGAKLPKGALLCGPPGTGKTLLAKAVAGEAGVPFYSISGSDFIEMFVGVGPSRVRDLFTEARANSPCIVFIDEIDAVGRQRGRGGTGGNDERENTLNQLLVEMDGFSPSTGVVVLAGTNRVDILDQALTRPGRFDRQITVDKPDLKGRKEIFKVHLKGITLEDNVDDIAGRLAGLTPGFAGADIANITNEAAIVAARRKGSSVSLEDFEKATDRIIGGLESNKIMSLEERQIVAHHEAGHAVAGWFLQHADPLLKVTIIPRASGALGFAQYLPKEVYLRTQEQIMDTVCMALAGRAAEEIFFGRVTTGASDDLKKVTDIVYGMIQLYGMNSRLGQLAFPKDQNAIFEERPYSEKTAKAMDEEARSIVDGAYNRTLELLRERRVEVEAIATMLLEKETITHDDVVTAIGARPFGGDPAYDEFLSRRANDQHSHEKDENSSSSNSGSDGPDGHNEPAPVLST